MVKNSFYRPRGRGGQLLLMKCTQTLNNWIYKFSFFTCFFFCNHFEELQTVLFEVKMIINNAPLTYAYSNPIETCLTPNHLLFGRQLLYYSNTTSTVVRNLTVLSSTTDKINRISNHFLDRWIHQLTWNTTNIKIKYRLQIRLELILMILLW